MKKEIKNGQGFICKDLEEKKRIWEKLIQHRYPMFADGNDPYYKHIVWEDGEFVEETNQNNIQPLSEAEFFDEWTPKPGEWVEAMNMEEKGFERQFMCTIDGVHYLFSKVGHTKEFCTAKYIRQIKPETISLKEAQDKLRELLGKPNLIIEP
jgi:hypothetical protein